MVMGNGCRKSGGCGILGEGSGDISIEDGSEYNIYLLFNDASRLPSVD